MSRRETMLFSGLLLIAGTMYFWNLSLNGWGNAYYAAAAQAGASDWTAFFFGSSDSGNAVTVDKLPASIWLSSLSVRMFGLSSWSLLAPHALLGVGTVALTYLTVRRHFRMSAAISAGTIVVLSPAAAIMFRYNNPDALLTLLLTLSLYLVVRAIEDGHWRWLLSAAVAVGLGFLTKSAQALVILPVFGIVYLYAGRGRVIRRLAQLAAALGMAVASAGWWLVIAENTQAATRPYAGGSFTNSFVEVLLKQNGLGRILGAAGGGSSQQDEIKAGPLKLIQYPFFGTQGSWLLFVAITVLLCSLVLLRRRPTQDPQRALLLLAGGWLLAYAGVFSYMSGVINPYYLVALAPPIGIVTGAGLQFTWAARRWLRFRIALTAGVLFSALLAFGYLATAGPVGFAIAPVVLVLGIIVTALNIPRLRNRRVVRTTAILSATTCLIGPALFTFAGVLSPHVGIWPAASLPAARVVFDSPNPDSWPNTTPPALRGTAIGNDPEGAVLALLKEHSQRRTLVRCDSRSCKRSQVSIGDENRGNACGRFQRQHALSDGQPIPGVRGNREDPLLHCPKRFRRHSRGSRICR